MDLWELDRFDLLVTAMRQGIGRTMRFAGLRDGLTPSQVYAFVVCPKRQRPATSLPSASLASPEPRGSACRNLMSLLTLMNAQYRTKLLLRESPLLDVLKQIAVEFCFYFDLQGLGKTKAKIIEYTSPRQVGRSFLAAAFAFHSFAPLAAVAAPVSNAVRLLPDPAFPFWPCSL